MSQLLLSRSPYRQQASDRGFRFHKPRSYAAASLKFEFGPVSLILSLFLVALFISFLYLAHFNRVATKGYDLKRLDAARQQLLEQHDIKDARLAEAKALTSMIHSGKMDGMRKPGNIIFVRGDTALASR